MQSSITTTMTARPSGKPTINLSQWRYMTSRFCIDTLSRIPHHAAESMIYEPVVTVDKTLIEEAEALAALVAKRRAAREAGYTLTLSR